MKITDFLVMNDHGEEIKADAFGNNLAFCCPDCGHPILAVALENQRGSDDQHPAVCKGCKKQYVLDIRLPAQKLYIQTLSPDA
jgi:hypothetical protein